MRLVALAAALALPIAAAAQEAAVGFGGGDFDRSAPVEVAADSLDIDQATGRAVLTGNVVIVQGELRLSADEVTVDYATDAQAGQRRIERMNAVGDVLLVAGEDAAEGRTATYTLTTAQVLMTGDVVVTQGGNTLAGDRLSIDLETGAGTVTGRVRTTLQP
jgi:lipopolysaccharide export system protein LptA